LVREGFDVVLLEASKFPRSRYTSLEVYSPLRPPQIPYRRKPLPSVRHYLRFIDAEEKILNHGFEVKVSIRNIDSVRGPLTS
jgi:hypothetical protein